MLSESLPFSNDSHDRVYAFAEWCSKHPSNHGGSVLAGLNGMSEHLVPKDTLALLDSKHEGILRAIYRVDIVEGDGWKFTYFTWRKVELKGSVLRYDWFLEGDETFALQFKLACL